MLIRRDSALCRHYYVIGLLQPRYVMPNLVAKTTRKKKEKWGEKRLQITVKYISRSMSTSHRKITLLYENCDREKA